MIDETGARLFETRVFPVLLPRAESTSKATSNMPTSRADCARDKRPIQDILGLSDTDDVDDVANTSDRHVNLRQQRKRTKRADISPSVNNVAKRSATKQNHGEQAKPSRALEASQPIRRDGDHRSSGTATHGSILWTGRRPEHYIGVIGELPQEPDDDFIYLNQYAIFLDEYFKTNSEARVDTANRAVIIDDWD